MKKVDLFLFFVLLITIVSSSLCQAQTTVGLGGGGGFTQSTGFRFELPIEFELSNHISLFGGPAYVQRRNLELIRKLPSHREYGTAEVDYLSLPVMLKLRLDWTPVRIYGLAGIELNYGLRLQATGVEDQRLFKEKLDFEPVQVNRLDGGFCVGAGFETDLRRQRRIFADFRYYLGVMDIDRSNLGEIYNEGSFVTLGFMMPVFQKP